MRGAIVTAATASDYAAFARLIRAYVDWCRARYRDDASLMDRVFGHQELDGELLALPDRYGPPNGRTLLARLDGETVGCVAYRRLPDGACEMKRLFVADGHKGRGIGRLLCEAIIAAARAEGFRTMRLDTADRLAEAIAMYGSIGFSRCAPFRDYPPDVMPHVVFMEMPLAIAESGR